MTSLQINLPEEQKLSYIYLPCGMWCHLLRRSSRPRGREPWGPRCCRSASAGCSCHTSSARCRFSRRLRACVALVFCCSPSPAMSASSTPSPLIERDITVHVFLCVCMWERERWGGRRKCFWGMIYLQGKFGRRNYENATAREKGLVDLENGVLRFENGCCVNGNIRLICWADWMRYLSEWKHPDFLLCWLDVWMRYLNFGFFLL